MVASMPLEIQTRNRDEVVILDVKGRITVGMESDSLRKALMGAFQSGNPRLLLNLSGVDWMDSAGLGDLVAAASNISRGQGVLHLLKPTSRIKEILALTRLDSLFTIHVDEDSAVASMNQARGTADKQRIDRFLGKS
jgi:anti-sigma B factor antagonist